LSNYSLAAEYEKKSHKDLCDWTGEEDLDEVQEENGVKYQFEMWERK